MAMTIVFGVFMAVLLVALVLVVVILIRIQNRQTKQLSDRGESVGRTTSGEISLNMVRQKLCSLRWSVYFE